MHVFLDYVRDFFLDHVEEWSETLVMYVAEVVMPYT